MCLDKVLNSSSSRTENSPWASLLATTTQTSRWLVSSSIAGKHKNLGEREERRKKERRKKEEESRKKKKKVERKEKKEKKRRPGLNFHVKHQVECKPPSLRDQRVF